MTIFRISDDEKVVAVSHISGDQLGEDNLEEDMIVDDVALVEEGIIEIE